MGYGRGVDEAISKLAGQPYDVVLLDMWLQDGCGMDVLLHVQRHHPELAVVVVAGAGDEASVIQYLKAGAQDYVPKRGLYLEQLGGHLTRAQARLRDSIRVNTVLTVLLVEASPDDIDLTRRHFERCAPHIGLVVQSEVTPLCRGWRNQDITSMLRCWICACPACRGWSCSNSCKPTTHSPVSLSPGAGMRPSQRKP